VNDHSQSSSAVSSTFFAVYLNSWYAQAVFSLTETTVNERRIYLLLLMSQNASQYLKILAPPRSNHNVYSFPAFDLFENVEEGNR